MFRVCTLLLFALALTAVGCETGSTHENKADSGLSGQNVGETATKSGPVPGSATGTDSTAYTLPEDPSAQQATAPTSTNANNVPAPTSSAPAKPTHVTPAKK